MQGTFIIKEKQCAILLALKDTSQQWFASKLARQSKSTYVFTSKFLVEMERLGFVKLEQKGKLRVASLTEKGVPIAISIEEISRRLEAARQSQETARQQSAAKPQEQKQERDLGVV